MPAPAARLHDPDENVCRALVIAALGAFAWIFLPLIPADASALGHDYALFLPNLLAGYYWFLANGPLPVPWYSPAQCGGVPFYADLNVAYYSFPQWASFAVGPTHAIRATLIVFAALGAAGFYVLLRGRYALAPAAAAVGAVLFLFSGFFAYRMVSGHLTFHPFTLVPWLAWAVLAPPAAGRAVERAAAWAWPMAAGGSLLALMFQAGMIHVLPVAGLAAVALVLFHGEMHGHRARPWLLLAGAVAVSLALSASRLAAALAFLENFPRSDYPLPGFARPGDLIAALAAALFWRVDAEETSGRMTDAVFALERHEWEYGLGPVAFAILVAGLAAALARLYRSPARLQRVRRAAPAWAALVLIMALPLLLNWHEPHWNGFLKGLPFFGSSSNLVRWFALYIPLGAALAALCVHALAPSRRAGLAIAAAATFLTVAWNAVTDKEYYRTDTYDARRVEAAWSAARASDAARAITHVAVLVDAKGEPVTGRGRNDAIVLGYSQMICYQPIFGYSLERLPFGPLRPGPALAEVEPGVLNIKDPSCYVHPRENGCVPGAHFTAARRGDAERFVGYRPYRHSRPARQEFADGLTLAALLLTGAVLLGSACLAWAPGRKTPPSG